MNHTERKKKRERKKDETKRRVRSECQETQGPGGVFVSGLMWGGEGGGVFSRFVRGASKAGILGRRGPRERRERRENEI